jgi:hypothetical protein
VPLVVVEVQRHVQEAVEAGVPESDVFRAVSAGQFDGLEVGVNEATMRVAGSGAIDQTERVDKRKDVGVRANINVHHGQYADICHVLHVDRLHQSAVLLEDGLGLELRFSGLQRDVGEEYELQRLRGVPLHDKMSFRQRDVFPWLQKYGYIGIIHASHRSSIYTAYLESGSEDTVF